MGLMPVFIYIIILNEGIPIQIMSVYKLGRLVSFFFFFFLSTAWFLISSFDQTLSSTVGWYINKFTWWVLRSRNPVLREQDMWGAELGICLYCFSCLKDLSWDHFSYMFLFFFVFVFFFYLTRNTASLLVNCCHNLRENSHPKSASHGWKCM